MTKFAVHYIDSQGHNKLWVTEAVDPEAAAKSFRANMGKFTISKIKVLRNVEAAS